MTTADRLVQIHIIRRRRPTVTLREVMLLAVMLKQARKRP